MPGTCGTSGRVSRWSHLDPEHAFGGKAIQVLVAPRHRVPISTFDAQHYVMVIRVCLSMRFREQWCSQYDCEVAIRARIFSATHAESGVKVLNIIMRDGTVVSPTDKNYPFKRVLYMYTATALEVSKDSPECQFIKFIATPAGLSSLRTAGFRVPSEGQGLTIREAADACG